MRSLLLIFALLASAPALADATTRIALHETARREVPSDRVIARLEGRVEAASAEAAQDRLNELMTAALERAQAVPGLDVDAVDYQVRPFRRQDRATRWIASQALALESEDQRSLLPVIADLQAAGLAVQHIGGRLSDTVAQAVRNELTVQALEALRHRVDLVASTLDLDFVGWADIGIDGAVPTPRPMLAEAAMMADTARAAPSAMTEAVSTVQVTVRATALMEP